MWGQSPDSLPFKRIFEPIAALARRRVGLRPVSATCKALLRMVPALLTFLSCCGHAAAQQQESYYEVEQIASETLDAPEAFDLSNPRATMRSFSDAAARADFEQAARALVPSDQTDVPRATLARMLHEVIDRQLWIDPGSLSDRPDALVEAVGDNPRAGQARRSLPLGTVEMDRYPVTIRLNRYKSNDHAPVWLFSQDTVNAIPALYELHGPGWLEVKLPDWWLARTPLSIRRWEIAALPMLVICAGLIAWTISTVMQWIQRRVSQHWLRRGIDESSLPFALLGAAIFGQVMINGAIGFSGEITSVLTPILIAGITIAIVLVILRIMDAGLDIVSRQYVGDIDDRFSRDERNFYTSLYALRRIVTLIAVCFGVGLVLWEIGIFRNIGISLLASAGVATVILGIAAQTVLGNILASLQIAIAKPIRIGDSVHYEGEWAYVEAVFFTYVRLRTWDDRRLIVPVKYFISRPFENWSVVEAKMVRTFYLVVDPMADTSALREKFLEFAKEDEDCIETENSKMLVMDQDTDGVHCRFYATAPDPTAAWHMHARLRERMLAWIRDTHPDWWPKERVLSRKKSAAADAGAVD
ncbi:mechanosensitive ion channel family protein [Tateyamaria pelophila]|uniref:mechanosensitive ion channel family protein n=1 Tax=Tateyamaria pelophila TaxID=328415 RepID=UPI001CBF367D|nr:mechanosensitive ion channel family protein [Tateyamaria pelophila]